MVFLGKNSKRSSVFDLIAPIYGLFYDYQTNHYNKVINKSLKDLDLLAYKSIIDIGCGTGALCSVLHQKGLFVTGIDPSQRMLNIAMSKNENKNIIFHRTSAIERTPFDDKSFDVSVASYVAHGLKEHERIAMYKEMSRITKHLIIFYDYNKKRSSLINIVEWLERGDYFNFIKKVDLELKSHFSDVRVIDVGLNSAWYICKPLYNSDQR